MPGKGWIGESVRHSNARRMGRAGPMYKIKGIKTGRNPTNSLSKINISGSRIIEYGPGDINITIKR